MRIEKKTNYGMIVRFMDRLWKHDACLAHLERPKHEHISGHCALPTWSATHAHLKCLVITNPNISSSATVYQSDLR
jgi:hypothetical protein